MARDKDRPQRGGKSGPGRNDDRETQISKALSSILRHRARELGLDMDDRGFVRVDELLSHNKFRSLKVTIPELRGIVADNAKQRFELVLLDETGDDVEQMGLDNPANYLIRATQGHSIKGLDVSSLLTPVLPTDLDFPNEVVHGTYPKAWGLILDSGGLKAMGRTHIHFAPGLPTGKGLVSLPTTTLEEGTEVKPTPDNAPVISGMRASASLLVWVDTKRAIDGGVKWWRSKNGVILTEGLIVEGKETLLPIDFVSRVVQRKDGSVVWKNDWWDAGKTDVSSAS